MDTRFRRTWRRADERRQAGEPLDRVMADMRTPALVEALAGAGPEDPVAANAIATALLNRMRVASKLFLAGAGALALATLVIVWDAFATGTWAVLESGLGALAILVVSLATGGALVLLALRELNLDPPRRVGRVRAR